MVASYGEWIVQQLKIELTQGGVTVLGRKIDLKKLSVHFQGSHIQNSP
jgi:hypothetical protein